MDSDDSPGIPDVDLNEFRCGRMIVSYIYGRNRAGLMHNVGHFRQIILSSETHAERRRGTLLIKNLDSGSLPFCFGIALFFFVADPALAQSYSTPQASPQSSPQSMPRCCPFPQGKCPFPQGFDALPTGPCMTPLASPQGTTPQTGMMPPYSYEGNYSKKYPAPKLYPFPKPFGTSDYSLPSSQIAPLPNLQSTPTKM